MKSAKPITAFHALNPTCFPFYESQAPMEDGVFQQCKMSDSTCVEAKTMLLAAQIAEINKKQVKGKRTIDFVSCIDILYRCTIQN
jgi:hypothetical protein